VDVRAEGSLPAPADVPIAKRAEIFGKLVTAINADDDRILVTLQLDEK
jgi:hypothetical protein